MKILSLSEAKMKFSHLVDRVNITGQEVVITKNGRPAAVLVSPLEVTRRAGSELQAARLAAHVDHIALADGMTGHGIEREAEQVHFPGPVRDCGEELLHQTEISVIRGDDQQRHLGHGHGLRAQ